MLTESWYIDLVIGVRGFVPSSSGLLSYIRGNTGPVSSAGKTFPSPVNLCEYDTLHQVVSPYKDVEGLHFKFHYNLYHK